MGPEAPVYMVKVLTFVAAEFFLIAQQPDRQCKTERAKWHEIAKMSWITLPGRSAFFSQTAMHEWDVFWTTYAVVADYGAVFVCASD